MRCMWVCECVWKHSTRWSHAASSIAHTHTHTQAYIYKHTGGVVVVVDRENRSKNVIAQRQHGRLAPACIAHWLGEASDAIMRASHYNEYNNACVRWLHILDAEMLYKNIRGKPAATAARSANIYIYRLMQDAFTITEFTHISRMLRSEREVSEYEPYIVRGCVWWKSPLSDGLRSKMYVASGHTHAQLAPIQYVFRVRHVAHAGRRCIFCIAVAERITRLDITYDGKCGRSCNCWVLYGLAVVNG